MIDDEDQDYTAEPSKLFLSVDDSSCSIDQLFH